MVVRCCRIYPAIGTLRSLVSKTSVAPSLQICSRNKRTFASTLVITDGAKSYHVDEVTKSPLLYSLAFASLVYAPPVASVPSGPFYLLTPPLTSCHFLRRTCEIFDRIPCFARSGIANANVSSLQPAIQPRRWLLLQHDVRVHLPPPLPQALHRYSHTPSPPVLEPLPMALLLFSLFRHPEEPHRVRGYLKHNVTRSYCG